MSILSSVVDGCMNEVCARGQGKSTARSARKRPQEFL